MAKRGNLEGTKFLRYFGPLLHALRKLGGSATPDEAAEQVAADLGLPDEEQNELLPSGGGVWGAMERKTGAGRRTATAAGTGYERRSPGMACCLGVAQRIVCATPLAVIFRRRLHQFTGLTARCAADF